MVPYPGTRSDVCTRAFIMPISVSENVQKNLVEFIHTISSTKLMHMIMQSLLAADKMTYAKTPTWDVRSVPRWYTSVTSSF